ncbi:hypothetical protein FFWV33_05810 [Flavobacterium faecale]|uniref:Signal peptidase n=1 Tax=Flavobacterium faecale TaxID=1355330 RepID=A0A2S1LBH3_9FLAO|nr:hypothetical protein [Flavobacterium faecale]AWG21082.1 hypothetical protein FFWV33_05810 [Flavobacterium faecale]
MKKNLHKYYYLFILLLAGTFGVIAQPPAPLPPPPGLPINDGVLFLGIAALSYGIFTIYNHTKKRKSLG